jgi:hypothetical protein
MKLDEILQTSMRTSTVPKKFPASNPFDDDDPNDKTLIGGGLDYTAHEKEDDPHEVSKRARTGRPTPDGQAMYFKTIIENGMSGTNICVPRIYDYHQIRDPNGDIKYEFSTERLINYKHIYKDELLACVHAVLSPTTRRLVKNLDERDADYIMHFTALRLTNMAFTGETTSELPDMNEALRVVHELDQLRGYNIDIHEENIMFRRTSVGLQLVLNDPIGGGIEGMM